MNGVPAVIVKKTGFFSALAKGFFSLLTVAVVCGAGLGFYGMRIFEKNSDRVFDGAMDVLKNLPEWQKWRATLPPVLADVLDDHRDVAYRQKLDIQVRALEPSREGDATSRRQNTPRIVIEVDNQGDQVVTMLAMRIALLDEDGVPVDSFTSYVATPIAASDWDRQLRGPILPGSQRVAAHWRPDAWEGLKVQTEVVDLRVAGDAAEGDAVGTPARKSP
jgi:hypothetical protein